MLKMYRCYGQNLKLKINKAFNYTYQMYIPNDTSRIDNVLKMFILISQVEAPFKN